MPEQHIKTAWSDAYGGHATCVQNHTLILFVVTFSATIVLVQSNQAKLQIAIASQAM
jgi:hypothetical protein